MPEPREFEWFPEEQAQILGHLDENGVVIFAIAASPDSKVRGTELFNRMLDDFGDEVKEIQGVWSKGSSGSPSINIDKVNELTARGIPLEEAVLHTWTVTRAAKRGFTKVMILNELEGNPGVYSRIAVHILK